jgi:hypothetical protein
LIKGQPVTAKAAPTLAELSVGLRTRLGCAGAAGLRRAYPDKTRPESSRDSCPGRRCRSPVRMLARKDDFGYSSDLTSISKVEKQTEAAPAWASMRQRRVHDGSISGPSMGSVMATARLELRRNSVGSEFAPTAPYRSGGQRAFILHVEQRCPADDSTRQVGRATSHAASGGVTERPKFVLSVRAVTPSNWHAPRAGLSGIWAGWRIR